MLGVKLEDGNRLVRNDTWIVLLNEGNSFEPAQLEKMGFEIVEGNEYRSVCSTVNAHCASPRTPPPPSLLLKELYLGPSETA